MKGVIIKHIKRAVDVLDHRLPQGIKWLGRAFWQRLGSFFYLKSSMMLTVSVRAAITRDSLSYRVMRITPKRGARRHQLSLQSLYQTYNENSSVSRKLFSCSFLLWNRDYENNFWCPIIESRREFLYWQDANPFFLNVKQDVIPKVASYLLEKTGMERPKGCTGFENDRWTLADAGVFSCVFRFFVNRKTERKMKLSQNEGKIRDGILENCKKKPFPQIFY